MCRTSRNGHGDLVEDGRPTDTSSVTDRSARSAFAGDAIVGYRAFVAVVVAAYFTFIALTPRQPWMPVVSWVQLLPLSALYLALGIWGFDYARRRSRLPVSVAYLLIEFAIGMRINDLAIGGALPLILLPLAAQAVLLLPRVLAGAMCVLVIAGVSGNLSWFPEWPDWLRNIAQATSGRRLRRRVRRRGAARARGAAEGGGAVR